MTRVVEEEDDSKNGTIDRMSTKYPLKKFMKYFRVMIMMTEDVLIFGGRTLQQGMLPKLVPKMGALSFSIPPQHVTTITGSSPGGNRG